MPPQGPPAGWRVATCLGGGTQLCSTHRFLINLKISMLGKGIQIQNNVISEESRLLVAWGWVGGVGDQGHVSNLGSNLYVLILILLMLFWIHTCVRPYWIAHFRRGFFFFFLNLNCTFMKLFLKQHWVKDMKHRFPQTVLTVEALVPWKVHTPGPPCRVSVMHQGSCASCKGARNSQALEMGNPHIK